MPEHQATSSFTRPASSTDVVLAVALTVVAQVDIWAPQLAAWGDDPVPGSRPLNAALFLVVTAAVAWRRSAPFTATVVAMAALALQAAISQDAPIGLLVAGPVLVLLYAAGAYCTRARAWQALAVAAVAVALHDLFDADIRTPQDVGEASYWWLVVASTWLAGRYVGTRRRARTAAEAARRREQELAESERQAVAVERLRIANELHDVVAHSVSVVVLQAGAALEVLERSPGRAREPLEEIERTARDALGQMGTLVGLLRAGDEALPSAGQPRLAELPDLARRARAAGLPVHLTVRGTARPLPSGVELSAYRIVQEALTNALKHAAGATRVDVVVDHRPQDVTVSVTDDGHGSTTRVAGGGHGLVGMRERAALYGGDLRAEPLVGGGFVVTARIPIEEDRP